MKTLTLVAIVFFTACQKDDIVEIKNNELNRINPRGTIMVDRSPIQLFIFNGESNSGGIAENSLATADELSIQPRLQIWNNFENHFESLHVGVNNLLGHWVLEPWINIGHGWELELSNIIKTQYPNKTMYLLKTGQGGTTISQWDTSGVHYKTMVNRIDSAMTVLRRQHRPIQVFVFYSQGINDILYSQLPDTVWQAKTQDHLNRIKALTGPDTRIVLSQHMVNWTNYNMAMERICTNDSTGRTTFVSGVGASTQSDGLHYDYYGMKTVCDRLFGNIQSTIQ